MARDFNGTSDYIEAGSVITALPITMACWFNVDTVTASRMLMAVGDSAAVTRVQLFVEVTTQRLVAQVVDVAGTGASVFVTGTPLDTWAHGCAVFASDTNRRVFLDGDTVTDSTNKVLGTPNSTVIGARYSSGVLGVFFDGLIAEAALWDVALDNWEVSTLALGFSPLLVRPQSLKAYWPILGRYSPEIDVRGGFNGTVTGTTVADHPRVLYKRRRAYVFKSGVVFQFARPDSDITPGSWTPSSGGDLFAMVDEVSADDADRIRSNTGAGDDAVTLGLSDITEPEAGTVNITIRHRIGT